MLLFQAGYLLIVYAVLAIDYFGNIVPEDGITLPGLLGSFVLFPALILIVSNTILVSLPNRWVFVLRDGILHGTISGGCVFGVGSASGLAVLLIWFIGDLEGIDLNPLVSLPVAMATVPAVAVWLMVRKLECA